MTNDRINKLIKNNIYLIVLIILIFISIFSTNYFLLYKKNQETKLLDTLDNIFLNKTLDLVIENLNPRFTYKNFKVEQGDTFEKLLKNLNITENEKDIVISNLSKFKLINKLFKGQKISFKMDNSNLVKIVEISIEQTKTKKYVFYRIDNLNQFKFREVDKDLKREVVFKESEITNSLYSSAINVGIQPNVIIEFARVYGFQIDFQRDIWKNDRFQIIYETFSDPNQKILDTGNILYANLILQGKENDLYIFKTKEGYEHFDAAGKSIKKSLMKTPINGARLSSSFGMRKHPILGYNKMHRGTDFAAPEGTPVMASGDGKIVRARWCGGGGNCIKIRHNSTYETVYAHLKNFARNIKEGKRVKQGQIIGYVGSTGLSTGPHLHYEVIINGKKVNSQKLKLPSGKVLKGDERKLFEVEKIKLNVLKSKLISSLN